MARSLQVATAEELVDLGPVDDGASGYRYRYTVAPDGETPVLAETRGDDSTHAFGVEVALAIGSGELDRSYAVAHGAGLWFSPVEVIASEAGRRAVLAPHASMHPGSRLATPITPECLGCHTDEPPPRAFPLNLRPASESWEPRGISCAACHGRVEEHVAWQEAELEGGASSGDDPVLSFRELGRFEELSVCAACHLQGDARLVLNEQELGPPPPGGDLLEQRALFVAATPTEEVGFVSQVERLVLSSCFRESEMTCTTCHDPHRSLSDAEERNRTRAACTSCHPGDGSGGLLRVTSARPSASPCSRDTAGGVETHAEQLQRRIGEDCVSCHMPLGGVFDVAELQIHDHFIRRDGTDALGPRRPDELRFAESPTGDWRRFTWPGEEPPAHVDDPGLWMMAYAGQEHFERALELVDRPPGPAAAGLAMYHHVRASLLESLGREAEARRAYERALELDPELAESAINLGLLLGRLGEERTGVELLDRVVERHPAAWGALRNRAVLRHGMGDGPGAVRDLEAAFRALPDATVAVALAKHFAAARETERAAQWRRVARELDPLIPLPGPPGGP